MATLELKGFMKEAVIAPQRGLNMEKRWIVRLTTEEREELQEMVRKGKTQAYKIQHAHILLKADIEGDAWTDEQIGCAYNASPNTVALVRQRFVTRGLEGALSRKRQERPSRERKLDGKGEAKLIALSCSSPPAGRSGWTMQLLADRLVELKVVEAISDETVRRTLKKTI
jgi:hypothetical protein